MRLQRKMGFYEKYIKRFLDIICSLFVIVVFWWLYAIIAIFVRSKLGSPVLFKQPRPGLIREGKVTIFDMYKFRTMTNERDKNGTILPDYVRLTKFGAWLRSTSLDELPEVFCILKGDMSVIGPRPQLVRDMVFMTDEQQMRHTARPGLSGLAQVNGRNAITWKEKLDWDLKYIENVSFLNDLKLVWITVKKVFMRRESSDELAVTLDYGDELLNIGSVNKEKYDVLQARARNILEKHNGVKK